MLFKVLEAPESAFEIWLWNMLSCTSLCLGLKWDNWSEPATDELSLGKMFLLYTKYFLP